jgi:hypothetical protein
MTNFKKSIWIYNLTKADVSLGDLYCTVPALSCIDLLKVTTEDKIQKSAESGSILKRKGILKFGGPPPKPTKKIIEVSKLPMQRPFKVVSKCNKKFLKILL